MMNSVLGQNFKLIRQAVLKTGFPELFNELVVVDVRYNTAYQVRCRREMPMFFQKDYNAPPEEDASEATGPRRFFQIISQEAAALLKLNLLFLLSCLPIVTIPPAFLALHQLSRRLVTGRGGVSTPE